LARALSVNAALVAAVHATGKGLFTLRAHTRVFVVIELTAINQA